MMWFNGYRIIYLNRFGSRANGINLDGKLDSKGDAYKPSDEDIRGIFLPKREELLEGKSIPYMKDDRAEDTVYYSLPRFLEYGMQGNPETLEWVFVRLEDVLYMDAFGEELREQAKRLLSKQIYYRFGGFTSSQLRKLKQKTETYHENLSHYDLYVEHGYDVKHGSQALRLQGEAIEALSTGNLHTYRPEEERKFLIDVRMGKYTLEEIEKIALKRNQQMDVAFDTSNLPEYPDFDFWNEWLITVLEKENKKNPKVGKFPKSKKMNTLPMEYPMVEACTLYLVSNRLSEKNDNSDAIGFALPYKDWTLGLRKFEELKFQNTTIFSLQKMMELINKGEPKAIDVLFTKKSKVLQKHSMAEEALSQLRQCLQPKQLYRRMINFTRNNLRDMEGWERAKKQWEQPKGKKYPPVPKGTDAENAAVMYRFGYDTLLASEVMRALHLTIVILQGKEPEQECLSEQEWQIVKNGKYATFDDCKKEIEHSLQTLEQAFTRNEWKEGLTKEEQQQWYMDFMERFYQEGFAN